MNTRIGNRVKTIWLGMAMVALFAAGGSSQAGDTTARVAKWGDTLMLDERVTAEIVRFATDEGAQFSTDYAQSLAADIRRLVFADVAVRLDAIAAGDIEPFVEVSYPEAGFAGKDGAAPQQKSERKFEDSFVRTELIAVFRDNDAMPETALRLYTNADFRKKATSRIERIWDEDGLNCVETAGVTMLLSPMSNCSRVNELILPDLAMQHSQVVRNGGGDGYQAVYFKESVKTFVVVPGGLVLHYINYSRTIGMGGLKKSLGRKKIKGSQEDAIESFRSTLPPKPAGSTADESDQ
jgi:hypothetical protein